MYLFFSLHFVMCIDIFESLSGLVCLYLEATSTGALFGCFLYLSKGWANSRKPLSPLEVPQIWIIATIVVFVQWMYLFFSPYFVAIVVVTYVVVLWFCYSKMRETVTILGTRLRCECDDL